MPIHDNVANVLERETGETIDNWYSRVEKENDLVSIFQTLQFHVKDERPDELLPDVMAIANEVDSQLAQAIGVNPSIETNGNWHTRRLMDFARQPA